MTKVHIDFESKATVDIWDCGAWVYSAHADTELLCIVYAVDDEDPHLIDRDEILMGMIPNQLFDLAHGDNVQFVAHNAFFERSIWTNILVKKYGLPEIPIERWSCTMAKANVCAIPRSLKYASLAMELSQTKDDDGKRIMLKLSKPRRLRKGEDPGVYWHEKREDLIKLYDYCKTDVVVERALDKVLPELDLIETKIWNLDQAINDKGVRIDIPAVKGILKLIHEYEAQLTAEVKTITKGYIDKVSRRQRVINWIEAQGVTIPNLQKQTVADLLTTTLPPKVRRVLEIKAQLSKTSTAKYQAMIDATGEDMQLRDTLMYHAASTGRWGGKLVQLHNLPRGNLKNTDLAIDILREGDLEYAQTMYGDLMGAISSTIRGMIIAKPEHDLIVADYRAIEARVLVWLADDTVAIKKFEKKVDLYVDIAKKIFTTEDVSKEKRALGKVTILGCGYGMGPAKFKDTCHNWGIDITEEMAENVVQTYRETYYKIKRMWYAQENAAVACVTERRRIICKRIVWNIEEDFLTCRLPSRRKIYYRKPKMQMMKTPWGEDKLSLTYMTVDSQTKQYVRTKTYGGKIVENITQAVARDIMAWSMCRCQSYKYYPVLTVHDEIVAEVPEGFGSVKKFIKILTAPLSWAKGCPIAAEGWRGKRYRK